MQSDYFTKALQGQAFHTHRKTLMGLDDKNDCIFYDKFKHPKINDDKLYTHNHHQNEIVCKSMLRNEINWVRILTDRSGVHFILDVYNK